MAKYEATWNSLRDHQITPKWLREGKFGIYTHWGLYSMPACGPNVSWYGFEMYRKGTHQYDYHVKNFGDPSKFGYKDFIPLFTADKFDAEEWAELFKNSGAKFAGTVAEHHDGFSMWNSKINKFNSMNMGPKRDIVGELEKAIRDKGMKYMVALHHAENWRFYPHWIKGNDILNPEYRDLYGEPHDLDWEQSGKGLDGWDYAASWEDWDCWHGQAKPSKNFLESWLNKSKEVVDLYNPDLVWFDLGIGWIQENYKKEFIAHYLNKADSMNQDVAVTFKDMNFAPGCGLIDLEQGSFPELTHYDWMTDTTVDTKWGWGYMHDAKYKTPKTMVHYLINNVSKNGYLLLNVGPKANGEIPEQAKTILYEMGKWLNINGEAIYSTTPWLIYGEGPTKPLTGGINDVEITENPSYTSEDIRFTVKDDILYAICLDWPKDELLIKSMGTHLTIKSSFYESEIVSINMLGTSEKLPWKLTSDGLKIGLPKQKPDCKYAYVFKIERKHPF